MDNKNKLSEDLENYIQNFQLKHFEDSDEDENEEQEVKKTHFINNKITRVDEYIKNNTGETTKQEDFNINENKFSPKNENLYSPTTENIYSPKNENIYSPKNENIIKTVRNQNIEMRKEDSTKRSESNFKNISNDYNKVFTKKVDIFSDETLKYELDRIENLEDEFEVVNLAKESKEIHTNLYEDRILSSKTQPQEFLDIPVSVDNETTASNLKSLKQNQIDEFGVKENYMIISNSSEIKLHRNFKLANFNKNLFMLSNIRNLQSVVKLIPIDRILSNNDLERLFEQEYFPISYSEKLSNNLKSLFSGVKSKIEAKQFKFLSVEDFILVNLISDFIDNNQKCTLLDFNAISKRKSLINNLKKYSSNYKEIISRNKTQTNNRKFSFDKEENSINNSVSNIIDKGLERILVECYNEKNSRNYLFFSIFGKKEDIYNYLFSIFEEKPEYKEDDLYIFFMIKSGNINKLIKDRANYIFEHFYSIIILLIQNYEYFDDLNVNLFVRQLLETESKYSSLDKLLILSILTNSFTFNSIHSHTTLLIQFLNFPTYSKIVYADFFNYICYQTIREKSEDYKYPGPAFCSILLKYKYVLMKKQNEGEFNDNIKEYCSKIYDNLKQFNGYSNNMYFQDYMKTLLTSNPFKQSVPIITSDKAQNKDKPKINNLNVNKEFEINKADNLGNMITTEKKNNQQINMIPADKKQGGITSFLVNALGFGQTPEKIIKPKAQQDVITEDMVKEKEPEIYWDAQKKRWVLRGQIYDEDKPIQQDTTTQTEIKSETITKNPVKFLPPKIKVNKPQTTENYAFLNENTKKISQESESPNTSNKEQIIESNTSATTKANVLSNPFAVKKNQNIPPPKIPPKTNLTNRYSSIVDFGNK